MKKWTIGVLGLGEGRSIISAILESDYWDLVTMCDLNEELCIQRAKEFDLSTYTTRYETMLEDPLIQVIGIYTPDQLHSQHIKMALEAGKHVICTKPLMLNLDDALELIEVQQRTGKTVFVGQSSRYFEPAIQQHKDFLEGKHGQLAHVEAHYITDARWFLDKPWSRKPGFSWMYNFLIHALDLALWYLPDIESVYGVGFTSENTLAYQMTVPDALTFLLKSKDGRTALIKGNYTQPILSYPTEQSISCTLRGTKGTSRAGYPLLKYHTTFDAKDNDETLHDFENLYDYYFRFEGRSHHAGEYQNYIEEFAMLMEQGITPKPDLMEGIHTLAVMEAMNRSLQSGQVVAVSQILKERKLTPYFT